MWSQRADSAQRETDIGLRLRLLREQRGLSQRELARLSELSPNTLSLIERRRSSPTASTLQKLAAALGVSISTLFEPEQPSEHIIYTRAGERPSLVASHAVVEDLGPTGGSAPVNPLLISIEPGTDSGSPMTHRGQEFVFCLEGRILFVIASQVFLLEPGDSLLFEAEHPHRWQNAGSETARALIVLCMSEEGARAFAQQMQGDRSPNG